MWKICTVRFKNIIDFHPWRCWSFPFLILIRIPYLHFRNNKYQLPFKCVQFANKYRKLGNGNFINSILRKCTCLFYSIRSNSLHEAHSFSLGIHVCIHLACPLKLHIKIARRKKIQPNLWTYTIYIYKHTRTRTPCMFFG